MIPQYPLLAQGIRPQHRESERFLGLLLDLNAPYLTLRYGVIFETYLLVDGRPKLVACSPGGFSPSDLFIYVRNVANMYAEAYAAGKLGWDQDAGQAAAC